ncbi:ABC transporter ATP-binding protein [Mycoplasmopsis ciconiae]|uniref:ABC transporter ATP-binding protein n=1 Tax=Mycoplasmopsis ciconiae TaxID=561067 RepID=A0ABU7ML09_9BACT|nr:ABC transporter ATP-binding protein [Mycoplasmopsis ciconiae]
MKENNKTLFSLTKGLRLISAFTVIFVILEVIATTLMPKVVSWLMDYGLTPENNQPNWNETLKYGLVIVALAVISLIFGVLGGITASKSAAKFSKNIREELFKRIEGFSFKNIDKFSNGSLITRLTDDIQNVENAYMMIIRLMMRAPIMLVFAVIMAYTQDVILASVLLAIVIVLATVTFTLIILAFKRFRKQLQAYDKLNNKIIENLNGIRTIKAFATEDKELSSFKKETLLVKKLSISAQKIVSYTQPIFIGSIFLSVFIFIIVATNQIVTKTGGMTFGILSSFIGYMWQVFISLLLLVLAIVTIAIAKASHNRISEVLKETKSIKNPNNGIKQMPNSDIDFVNVSLKYNSNSKLYSLNNIDLSIKQGQTIGIIGTTGSGKSSFVNLIPRLYDTTIGSIKIGGVDVKEYDLDFLRKNISFVPQQNVLFSGTIRENLKWGNPQASDSEIDQALKIASAYDFVYEKENNLDYYVEEKGNNFSGGQKQRLCIARALVKKSKILILDDSTSAVDNKTDKKIRQALKENLKDITKIIISQRISSIQESDKIIVIDEGKILDFDTHENLIKNNKLYRDLYLIQKGEKNEEK